jgi:hypothetical protein
MFLSSFDCETVIICGNTCVVCDAEDYATWWFLYCSQPNPDQEP